MSKNGLVRVPFLTSVWLRISLMIAAISYSCHISKFEHSGEKSLMTEWLEQAYEDMKWTIIIWRSWVKTLVGSSLECVVLLSWVVLKPNISSQAQLESTFWRRFDIQDLLHCWKFNLAILSHTDIFFYRLHHPHENVSDSTFVNVCLYHCLSVCHSVSYHSSSKVTEYILITFFSIYLLPLD